MREFLKSIQFFFLEEELKEGVGGREFDLNISKKNMEATEVK